MDTVISNIFGVNLGVKKGERVLVFADLIREDENLNKKERERREGARDVAKKAAKAGEGFTKNVTYMEFPSTGTSGKEPPEKLWEVAFGKRIVERLKGEGIFLKILGKEANEDELTKAGAVVKEFKDDTTDCVIALSNFSTTHTKFRELLTDFAGVRYASMPVFDKSMLTSVMTADWEEIRKRTRRVCEKLSGSEKVRITTPNGTDVSFSIKGRKVIADTGILTEPGSYGNLPAGEAFTAPLEGSAEGKMVIAWGPTRELKSPVTLTVKGGKVTEVTGDDELAAFLKEKIAAAPLAANIAEFGVGTNDKAKKPDNILESEKILGTIHIALGDNSTFGGAVKVPFHQDFVFFSPTVEIEKGEEKSFLLKDSKLIL